MQHCERSASHYFRIIPQPKEVTHTDYMVGTIRRKNTNVLICTSGLGILRFHRWRRYDRGDVLFHCMWLTGVAPVVRGGNNHKQDTEELSWPCQGMQDAPLHYSVRVLSIFISYWCRRYRVVGEMAASHVAETGWRSRWRHLQSRSALSHAKVTVSGLLSPCLVQLSQWRSVLGSAWPCTHCRHVLSPLNNL